MRDRERELLIEKAVSAWRPENPRGGIRPSPAWHDLDSAGRDEVYRETLAQRALEASLDSDGLSATARAVLGRIVGG